MTARLKQEFCNLALALAAFTFAASCSASPETKPEEEASSAGTSVAMSQPPKTGEPVSNSLLTAKVTPNETVDGSMVFVEIQPKPGLKPEDFKAVFEGTEYAVFAMERDWGALVGVPFNTAPRETVIEILPLDQGERLRIPLKVNDGKYPIEQLKVEGKYVDPPKKTLKRIQREQKEVGAVYVLQTKKRYWNGPFMLPINSEVTSHFGNKRYYNGQMRSFHPGTDLRARTPVPIYAPEGGKVVLSKDLYFTGKTVILDHGYGMFTIYAHMSKLEAKKGKEVKKGDRLGLSGATGRIQGPHLHWGLVLQKHKLNPLDLTRVLR